MRKVFLNVLKIKHTSSIRLSIQIFTVYFDHAFTSLFFSLHQNKLFGGLFSAEQKNICMIRNKHLKNSILTELKKINET